MIRRGFVSLFIFLNIFGLSAARAESCARELAPDLDFARMARDIRAMTGATPVIRAHRLVDRQTALHRAMALTWLELRLRRIGLEPRIENFARGANIVAEIEGVKTPNESVELGGHYDSIGPGADDNAAGVALLLELARLFKLNPPERTVRFVFFDLEEVDSSGAAHHVESVAREGRGFKGALIVDAIGYFPPDHLDPRVLLELGARSEAVPHLLNENLAEHALSAFAPRAHAIHLLRKYGEIGGHHSDHGPYWDRGLPALLFSRPYGRVFNSPHNHDEGDTLENMNWPYYRQAAEIFAALARGASRRDRSTPRSSRD